MNRDQFEVKRRLASGGPAAPSTCAAGYAYRLRSHERASTQMPACNPLPERMTRNKPEPRR